MTTTRITMELGWEQTIKRGMLDHLNDVVDAGLPDYENMPFTHCETATIYVTCYQMCTQGDPTSLTRPLYDKIVEAVAEYMRSRVLPALADLRGPPLLTALARRIRDEDVFIAGYNDFFKYIDMFYVTANKLPTTMEARRTAFRDIVFAAVKPHVTEALLRYCRAQRGDGAKEEREATAEDMQRCVHAYSRFAPDAVPPPPKEEGAKEEEEELDSDYDSSDDYETDEEGADGAAAAAAAGRLLAKKKKGAPPGPYELELEVHALEAARAFYRARAEEWVAAPDFAMPQFLARVDGAFEQERAAAQSVLEPSTEPKMLQLLDEELLIRWNADLLAREAPGCLAAALDRDEGEAVGCAYRMFARIPEGLKPLAAIYKQFILERGDPVMHAVLVAADEPAALAAMKSLVQLHAKIAATTKTHFRDDAQFHQAMHGAFKDLMNRAGDEPLQPGQRDVTTHLCAFADRLQKAGSGFSEAEAEEGLEQVAQLFAHLTDQDLFAEMYRSQMARRLLNERSASNDLERSFVSKLKARCGAQFTAKMEGMLNDLTVCADLGAAFKADECAAELPVQFGAQTLTGGHWPNSNLVRVDGLRLPAEMHRCLETYAAFFNSKLAHRRLQWVHSLGQCTMRAVFGKRTYDLQVTTLQAVVLLAFNKGQPAGGAAAVPFSALQGALGISEDILKRVLHSLACGKHRVLLRAAGGGGAAPSKGISTSDEFSFNDAFSCPLRKVRIPMSTIEETSNAAKNVEVDRSIAIEAAIVRIMKARTVLDHNTLLSEVIMQLSFFKPSVVQIKQRIEALIGREYLARDPEQIGVYNYLA